MNRDMTTAAATPLEVATPPMEGRSADAVAALGSALASRAIAGGWTVFGYDLESLRRDVLPGAQLAYENATKGFDLGKFSFLDVLDAQRTLFQARNQYLRALTDTHRAAAEIDRLLADRISE